MDAKIAGELFDYLENVSKQDNVITIREFENWYKKLGPDLNGDGKVDTELLYRRQRSIVSQYTGRPLTIWDYKTTPCIGYEPYRINGIQVSECDLGAAT
jgi:hypothetical protein